MRSLVLVLALLVACPSSPDDDDSATPEEPTPEPTPSPMEDLFSFVIIADPHIAGPAAHEDRLRVAVDWVNENAAAEGIELVVVLGDIGWGSGLETSRTLLEGLAVPWAPIIGDNVLHSSGDQAFAEMFAEPLDELASIVDEYDAAPMPVWDERLGEDAWFQGIRFTWKGVRFVGVDWNIRHLSGNLAEFGDFNDVPGGSWEWLEDSLQDAATRPEESVLLLSHVPMLPAVFSIAERDRFADLLAPIRDRVFGNLAGHLHIDVVEEYPEEGYVTWVTDATWDDMNAIRVVRVQGNEVARSYTQEVVELPEAPVAR